VVYCLLPHDILHTLHNFMIVYNMALLWLMTTMLMMVALTRSSAFQSSSSSSSSLSLGRSTNIHKHKLTFPHTRSKFALVTLRSADAIHDINLDNIEKQAQESSESWGISVTPFLNEVDAGLLEDRLGNRADIGYIKVGGFPNPSRTRFVMTNPDLELDQKEMEAEHCVLLCVDNINSAVMPKSSARSRPWPHVLMGIGIDLQQVGDVILEDGNAYIIIAPEVARQCTRLLPKELKGVGITVRELELCEYVPYDGLQQDMELGTMDKRALKYK